MVLDLKKSDVRDQSKKFPSYRLLKRRSILIEGRSVHSRFEIWVGLRRRRRGCKGLERLAGWDLNVVALVGVNARICRSSNGLHRGDSRQADAVLLPLSCPPALERTLAHQAQASPEFEHPDGMGSYSKTLSTPLGRWHRAFGGVTGVLEIMALGMKGAALAALGEMASGFFPTAPAALAIAPLGERKDGVKLGESTLSDFLTCALGSDQHMSTP